MMKIKLVLVYLIAITLGLQKTMAQINLSWLVQYNELDRHSNVTHALLDSFENVVVAVTNSSKQVGFETNASILKYDATGAQVFKWQRLDSLNGEVVNDLSTDTAGNIYALTYVSNVWQLDTLHLIKIDGTTGQVIFDISVDTNLFNRKMKLYDNHVYVVLGVPQNVILKYDLQGNLIWSKSLVHFFKVLDIQFNRSYMYVIGDSINNNMQRVRCFDTSGVYLWQHLMSYRQFYDAEIDNDGKLWIVGAEQANNKNFVYSLDTLGKLWDTLIYTTSGGSYNARLSFDSQNNIYSGFNVGSTWKGVLELFKIGNYQVTKIAIVDSCFNNISIPSFNGLSMKCLENDDILIASTYYSNVNAPKLYEISRIDSTGNFKGSYKYNSPNTTYGIPLLIENRNANLYLIGSNWDTTFFADNTEIIKFADATFIPEVFEKYNITLFPNPNFGGTIYFSKLVINADISIHTSDGALVTSYRNFTGNEIRPNDKLLSGLYFITLTDQHNSVTKKLIIYDENE